MSKWRTQLDKHYTMIFFSEAISQVQGPQDAVDAEEHASTEVKIFGKIASLLPSIAGLNSGADIGWQEA